MTIDSAHPVEEQRTIQQKDVAMEEIQATFDGRVRPGIEKVLLHVLEPIGNEAIDLVGQTKEVRSPLNNRAVSNDNESDSEDAGEMLKAQVESARAALLLAEEKLKNLKDRLSNPTPVDHLKKKLKALSAVIEVNDRDIEDLRKTQKKFLDGQRTGKGDAVLDGLGVWDANLKILQRKHR